MFWKYNNPSTSQIDALLAKEDVTLHEIMDEDDIINECKVQNKLLVEFLSKPVVIEELVTLTTVEPSADGDDRNRFKYSNIACEILTSDVSALNEKIAGDETHLAKLYAFLDGEPPLNSLLASFYSKIMAALIAKKNEQNWLSYQMTCLQVLDFLRSKESFVANLLKHLGTSAIMDLVLKLMTQVECAAEHSDSFQNWLDGQRLVQSLVALLSPSVDSDVHGNVAQLLCDFVKMSRENLRNNQERGGAEYGSLLKTLESPETVRALIDSSLSEPQRESCIVGAVQVLLALMDAPKTNNCDEINEADSLNSEVIETTTLAILDRLADFHSLLKHPPKKAAVSTTVATLDPPVGNTRLHVVKLLAVVLSRDEPAFVSRLIDLGTTQVLLDLFFAFPWNNFLHAQVETYIACALKQPAGGDDNVVYEHMIVECKLVEKVLGAWEENDKEQLETKKARKGYMGHLTNIALSLADLLATTSLGRYVQDNAPHVADSFGKFNEGTLAGVRDTHEKYLGGANPNDRSDDADEYGDVRFGPPRLLHQQTYAQYQVHQLTQPAAADFTYDDLYDSDFVNGTDVLQTIDHRTSMDFDLAEGDDLAEQHEMFKQMCAQNVNTLDDGGAEVRGAAEEQDKTYPTVVEKRGAEEGEGAPLYGSDSEEESPPIEDPFATIDPWEQHDPSSLAADLWTFNGKPEDGWANFADFDTVTKSLERLKLGDCVSPEAEVKKKKDDDEDSTGSGSTSG